MRHDDDLPNVGRVEAVILGALLSVSREMYGLQILEEADGLLKRGSLYVTLQRMEDKGLVESHQEERPKPEVGIPRRLYKVTGVGASAFNAYRARHQKLNELMAMA
jgi:DNA-binding PadR family transcriptional regulator